MAIDRWQELQQTERKLLEKSENLKQKNKKLKKINEEFEEQFFESRRLIDDLGYMFRGSDSRIFFENELAEFSRDYRIILENLEAGQVANKTEVKKLDDKLEELLYEKRKVMEAEKEAKK